MGVIGSKRDVLVLVWFGFNAIGYGVVVRLMIELGKEIVSNGRNQRQLDVEAAEVTNATGSLTLLLIQPYSLALLKHL